MAFVVSGRVRVLHTLCLFPFFLFFFVEQPRVITRRCFIRICSSCFLLLLLLAVAFRCSMYISTSFYTPAEHKWLVFLFVRVRVCEGGALQSHSVAGMSVEDASCTHAILSTQRLHLLTGQILIEFVCLFRLTVSLFSFRSRFCDR